MANHAATKKDARQSLKRREHNKYYAKTMRNAYRKFLTIDNKSEAKAFYDKLASMLDKLAKRNIVHKNKAANLKSQAAKHINALA